MACSSLRSAYDALLKYDAQIWAKKEGEVGKIDFEQLILKIEKAFKSTRPYLSLFAEPYVFFLVQNGQQKEAEAFIEK